MVIFKLCSCIACRVAIKPIYIPIWWYSNKFHLWNLVLLPLDLHSNMVIFKPQANNKTEEIIKLFTFQYGDIQTEYKSLASFKRIYLHSNMVIFKLIYGSGFTFIPLLFTFQYGDIQTIKSVRCLFLDIFIYIPIWWYSNFYFLISHIKAFCIYIPIWWYSNPSIQKRTWDWKKFTFQYGDIQTD